MGQPKGGGYQKLDVNTPGQNSYLNQLLQQAFPNQQAAAQGFAQFLPGGGGGQAITDQANKNFQQQSIPAILNAFGQNVKGSSALNNALASGASGLNTDLAAQLANMQLGASQGIGSLGLNQGQQGQSPQFAYQQKQQPLWQQLLLQGTSAAGDIGRGFASNPSIFNRVNNGQLQQTV